MEEDEEYEIELDYEAEMDLINPYWREEDHNIN